MDGHMDGYLDGWMDGDKRGSKLTGVGQAQVGQALLWGGLCLPVTLIQPPTHRLVEGHPL